MSRARDLDEKFDDMKEESPYAQPVRSRFSGQAGILSGTRAASTGTSNQSENYSTGFIIHCVHRNCMSDEMKKQEKLQSKGAESERERSTKRPGTGA